MREFVLCVPLSSQNYAWGKERGTQQDVNSVCGTVYNIWQSVYIVSFLI